MNRRSCIGMICGGCVAPYAPENKEIDSSQDTGTHSYGDSGFDNEESYCAHDVLIDAPLMDMDVFSTISWDLPEEFLRLLIIRTQDWKWNALWRICTHGNCDVEWNAQDQVVVCPCHNSIFSIEGLVLQGPATRDLRLFPVCYDEESQQFYVQVS